MEQICAIEDLQTAIERWKRPRELTFGENAKRAADVTKLMFILGSPNTDTGELSPISVERITVALNAQRADPEVVLLATGGFGAHFNVTETPHRELVYRHLEAAGANLYRAEASDLFSSNTVEDIALIAAFAEARSIDTYAVVTSKFHAERCRFIIDSIAADHLVAVLAGRNPEDLTCDMVEHEVQALERLVRQGGVLIGQVLHPHPSLTARSC